MASVKKVRARKIRKMDMEDTEVLDGAKKNKENTGDKEIKETGKSVSKKKVGTRKIRMSLTKAEEKKMDKEMERSDNMSIGVMVLILVICFVVGITLGYFLYRIAINGAL